MSPKAESTRQVTPEGQPTSEVKVETAQIGTRLSEAERAKRLKEGLCFGCGEHGHRRQDCPKQRPKAQVAVVEPAAADGLSGQASQSNLTHEESKN